jgi:hypothetical protein
MQDASTLKVIITKWQFGKHQLGRTHIIGQQGFAPLRLSDADVCIAQCSK